MYFYFTLDCIKLFQYILDILFDIQLLLLQYNFIVYYIMYII